MSKPPTFLHHPGIDEEIKTSIRTFRSLGKFADGASFIQSLPTEVRLRRSIAVESAELYLVQGQLKLAAEVCHRVSESTYPQRLSDDDLPPSFIWEAEVAAFELLRAYVWIGRYSKLKTALKIAQRVGRAWSFGYEDVKRRSDETTGDGETSEHHNDLLVGDRQSSECSGVERRDDGLSEYRVLLEFYYWKILVVVAEQGILDETAIKASAAKHISTLRKSLHSTGRRREARFLIYFEADMIGNADDSLRELQDFAKALNDPKWDTEMALTMVDIGQRQLKSANEAVAASAEESLKEAERLFQKVHHGYGEIEVELTRISANNTISAGEKFVLITKVADRYFDVGHLQNGIRCLAFGISPDMIIDLYADHVVRALELLQQKIEESGSEILKQLSLIHSVCQASLKAPEYGFALQSLESYYANVPEEIGPKYHSFLALTLATVYSAFGEHHKALRAAEDSFHIAESCASYEVISDAAFIVGLRRNDISRLYPGDSPEAETWMISAMDIMKEWAERDARNSYVDGEVQKSLMIATWENARAIKHPERETGSVEKPWIDRVKQHVPDSADLLKRSGIVDIEIKMLMRQKKYSEGLELSTKYLNDLNKLSSVNPFTKAQAFLRSSFSYIYAIGVLQEAQPLPGPTGQSAIQLLWEALVLATKALQLYRQTNGAEIVLDCTTFVWSLLNQVIGTMEEPAATELLKTFMNELHETERLCDEMRRSVVPIGGLKSLMSKRFLVSKKANLELYNIGISLALRLNDHALGWEWLQKGKARAFADSLGANVFFSHELIEKINSDTAACDLLKQEEGALEVLKEPGINFVICARRLASIRRNIAENSMLADIMKVRDGKLQLDLTNDICDALARTSLTPEMVKFVDWYVPSSNGQSDSRILLFVRQLDAQTIVIELPVTITEVKNWMKKTFEYPEMADPPLSKKTGNRLLQKMNVLCEGLSKTTQENDLLVLSPSGFLNNVPLHALFVDNKPLLQRNLVVYSSSVATLRQCLHRVNSKSVSELGKSPSRNTTKFFAVYEEPFQAEERDRIFSHASDLASKFGGTIFLGPEVTKDTFLEESSTARWVHYHGHASYGKDDVLKSSLILSNGKDVFKDNIDVASEGRDELSVSELFKARLLRDGVHFTVVACDSGTQHIAPGDEPLGLIPGLLHAGATSILACQWPINSHAGRIFSDAFYEELNGYRQNNDSSNGVIYLAKALQIAVGRMARGELGAQYRLAYYWAPFALHGLWFFPN